LLLKALLVMLVPLQFNVTSVIDLIFLPFNGLLFTPSNSNYYYPEFVRIDQPFLVVDIFSNFLLGLFLAFPAIVFNYRLSKSPANKPFRNLAIGVMVLSSFIVFMALLIVMPLFSPIYYYNYQLISNLQTFPTIAIGAFVILPMIQRQAVLIASPEGLHSNTMREIEMHPQLKVRREKTLTTILWIVLYFFPFLMLNMSSIYYSYASVLSFSYTMNMYAEFYRIIDLGFPTISGMVTPFISLPIIGILSALRFVYVRDIYRYHKHEIPYRRMMYMGILGDIFPLISYMVITGIIFPGGMYSASIIPLPFLFFMGLLIARLHRSVLPYANRVWEDVDARMWFEQEEESRPIITTPIVTTPENPHRPTEERITVPFAYMLVSHIRKKRQNNHSDNDTEE